MVLQILVDVLHTHSLLRYAAGVGAGKPLIALGALVAFSQHDPAAELELEDVTYDLGGQQRDA